MLEILDLTQLSFSESRTKSFGMPPVKACFEAEAGVRLSRNWNRIKYWTRICRLNDVSASYSVSSVSVG
jgi:hypothetical protein